MVLARALTAAGESVTAISDLHPGRVVRPADQAGRPQNEHEHEDAERDRETLVVFRRTWSRSALRRGRRDREPVGQVDNRRHTEVGAGVIGRWSGARAELVGVVHVRRAQTSL
jgi:hypothetical protein